MKLGTVLLVSSVLGPFAARAEGLTPEMCNALTAHVPSEDITYQPGVDVEGRTVAPADLADNNQLVAPDSYSFDLFVPLDEAVTIDAGDNLERIGQSEIGVGTVTVEGNQVYYNDQPLQSEEAHALAEACRELQAAAKD
jgi:hypothetical protein